MFDDNVSKELTQFIGFAALESSTSHWKRPVASVG
jgi:hypothetical protein